MIYINFIYTFFRFNFLHYQGEMSKGRVKKTYAPSAPRPDKPLNDTEALEIQKRSIISNIIKYSMQIEYFAIEGLNIIKLLLSNSQRRVQPWT